jgi:signal peptidase I
MLLSLFKTEGHSMEPNLKNGSFFMGSSIPYLFKRPKVGDYILFKSNKKIIVKKLVKIDDGKHFVKGENLLDSKEFNYLNVKEILGKVILKF